MKKSYPGQNEMGMRWRVITERNTTNKFMFLKTNETREFYKLRFLTSETAAPKNLKQLIPSPGRECHRQFDQIRKFLSSLSLLLIEADSKGSRCKDKQLHSHARACDVLIVTLFKRLYNLQSFIALVAAWKLFKIPQFRKSVCCSQAFFHSIRNRNLLSAFCTTQKYLNEWILRWRFKGCEYRRGRF